MGFWPRRSDVTLLGAPLRGRVQRHHVGTSFRSLDRDLGYGPYFRVAIIAAIIDSRPSLNWKVSLGER